MTTLYDILGARANDDPGTLKDAFRKAVRANHPDLNAGDPDAPGRFVQIVRAKSILGDPELRALYDRMLEYERQQLRRPSKLTAIIDAMHNIVSDSIAVIVLAVVLAGAYTVFTYISEMSVSKGKVVAANLHEPANVGAVASSVNATTSETPLHKHDGVEAPVSSAAAAAMNSGVADVMHEPAEVADVRPPPVEPSVEHTTSNSPSQKLEVEAPVPSSIAPTMNGGVAVEGAAQQTADVAVVRPPPPADPARSDGPHDDLESAKAPVPSTAAPTVTRNVVGATRSERLASNVPLKDAKFYREQGIASYHKGDVALAIADFDLAIQLDPNFAGAYIDRAVALYRMRQFNRAFADIAQARRIAKSHRNAASPKVSRLSNND
jgi:hypothetical protein